MSGSVSAGKSFLGCWKGFILNMMYPGSRFLICRKEARSLQNSTIKTLLEKVIPKDMIIAYNQQKGEIIHRTLNAEKNSTITFCGLDKKADQSYPTKIASTEYSWIFIDEGTEVEEGDWNMLITRIRHKAQPDAPNMMWTATNPDSPIHFLYKFFFETKAEDREYILVTPYDNPYNSKDYLHSLETSLSGIAKERLLYGKWVQAEGIIYSSFDPNVHVVKNSVFLPIKDYDSIEFGADQNYPLPRAGILAGFRGDGSVDVLDEFYKESSHVEELIKWLQQWQVKREWAISGYHDPSSPECIEKIDNAANLNCDKANNDVIAGISEVSRLFDNKLIRINENCTNLIKELQSYRWDKKGEKPLKEHDHLMDSLRYLCLSHSPNIKPFVFGVPIFK
jgi:PBSX family phage terminase large subunit